jgi:hypothetical protein
MGVALALARTLTAQPEIEHEDAGCMSRGEFTQFTASILPPSSIRTVKLYFRSSFYPEFYFVPMIANEAGAFEAVMPMPSDETTKVVYYFEAVDLSFQTSRSAELEVSVSDEASCRRGPGAAVFPGGNPAIVVGAVQTSAPAIPVGFQATGITGFLSAGGAVASTGGGIGVAVAVGAAAGAAAGVGVLVSNGSAVSTTTATTQGGGNTTSTSSASTSTTTTIGGGSTTTSSGPSTSSISSTTTSAEGGSTTTSSGPSTSSIPASLTACFTWQALGNCRVFFDSCSTPASSVARYEWRMLGPPVPEPPQVESFTFSFEADPRCRGTMIFNHPVRLTVYDEFGGSDSDQQNVSVRSAATSRTDDGSSAILSFRSHLATLPPIESARGQIVVNGMKLPPSSGASPTAHELRVRAGTVQIEAVLLTRVAPGSLWELDFSSSESVIPGSLRPEWGSVASADGRRIVFRLNGDRGDTFRFRLEAR